MQRTAKIGVMLFITCLSVLGGERTGWGWGGVPALNYNADDGFGYGVLFDLFNYSKGGYSPYYFRINPILFFTTGGKQDHTLFFDSPYLLGQGWRFNIRLRYKDENYYPYYGLGNDAKYEADWIATDEDGNSLDTLHGKHYYTMQNNQLILIANFQKGLKIRPDGKPLISALFGVGGIKVRVAKNKNAGLPTKFEEDINSGLLKDRDTRDALNSYYKLGLIYDSRDNEPAPNCGIWTDLLVEWYTRLIGSDNEFWRLTFTDRRYWQLQPRLVYANRMMVEKIFGNAPFTMLYPFGSSFRADEGLGGYRTLRGVLKNRYIGTAKFLVNMELRYRLVDFKLGKNDFYLAANGFFDWGRVWHREDLKGGLSNLHFGKGAGLHLAWNENFIVYAEMGFSKEAGSQLYVDIGYLY